MQLLVDNDIFCKLHTATLLDAALGLFHVTRADCGRLPALPHMLRRGRLRRSYGNANCDAALPIAESLVAVPDAAAATLEHFVSVDSIDPGEAQMFALSAERSLVILTGDKRALRALSGVTHVHEAMAGRVACLEAVLVALCEKLGEEPVRRAVQPLLSLDTTVRICFSSDSTSPTIGLRSYLQDVKRQAHPLSLWDPDRRA
jgi:hypothetical protein